MSESEHRPDGRRTDGLTQTTGHETFRTRDIDEATIEQLADRFGDKTAGIRAALRIARSELDLDVEGER